MAAKNVILSAGPRRHEEGVLPGLSEKVTGAYRRWFDRLLLAIRLAMPPDCPYTCIHAESLVGLFTCIFVKNSERVTLKDMAISTIKRGMGGRYGNKVCASQQCINPRSLMFVRAVLLLASSLKTRPCASSTAILLPGRNMFEVGTQISRAYWRRRTCFPSLAMIPCRSLVAAMVVPSQIMRLFLYVVLRTSRR